MGDTRLPERMADVMRILAAGINVVGSSPGCCNTPGCHTGQYISVSKMLHYKVIQPFHQRGRSGIVNDLIPLALPARVRHRQVRCMEIHDYASYDAPRLCTTWLCPTDG